MFRSIIWCLVFTFTTSSIVFSQEQSNDLKLKKFEAARAFAEAVAGNDDARFVEVLEQAYKIATPKAIAGRSLVQDDSVFMQGLTPVQSIQRFDESKKLQQSIHQDPIYKKNLAALLKQDEVNPRILGGQLTNTGEFPDCVAIGSDSQWCCTGTLISPNVVITAGHCNPGCTSRVYFGTNTQTPDPNRIVRVKTAIKHIGYSTPAQDVILNDLTILILERKVDFAEPRKLASAAQIDAATSCRLVGFGATNTQGTFGYGSQRKVDVAIASNSCDLAASNRYACNQNYEIVAGGGGRDSCNGDSGGPLYIKVDNNWMLAGATSRATKEWRLSGRACGEGGIYVRLAAYRDWLNSTIAAHNGEPIVQ